MNSFSLPPKNPQPASLRGYRRLRTLVSTAALLSLLGSGNIIFGSEKANEYQRLLLRGNVASAAPADGGVERQQVYLEKVEARLAFYNLVVLTGKGFLALAGLVLLSTLLSKRGELSSDKPRAQE